MFFIFQIKRPGVYFLPLGAFLTLITMKISNASTITAPIIMPIMPPLPPLTDDFVVVVGAVVVILVFLVVVPAADEVVVLNRLAKMAKVLKWSTEAVIV